MEVINGYELSAHKFVQKSTNLQSKRLALIHNSQSKSVLIFSVRGPVIYLTIEPFNQVIKLNHSIITMG